MTELRTSPKDVFLHLLMMVTLYIGVISLIALSFAYVDYWHPDLLNYYPGNILDTIRFSSSMLIVSFPLFLLLSWFIQKDLRKNPKKHDLRFSKWLIYLTLLVAAITIIIDLIQLVNRFYAGDLTLPFFLKVLSVLILAGAVFGYYIWDVQSEPHKSKVPGIVGWASSFLVLGMLVLGFFVAGSPAKQREIRMDERRVNDLQMLQSEIINYWQLKQVLPSDLDQLKNKISGFIPPRDPETDSAYDYKVLAPFQFELCATFNSPSPFGSTKSLARIPSPYDKGYYNSSNEVWDHDAGLKCFERTIDPELYPKPSQPAIR
ncbi:hypothetical protein KAR91_83255 [Candidatus Pacearchaeota archaeon]|nr:hypothetical protein [Candidatus Pacearchaeota archaeon]